jgi:hypothetical protein
MDKEDIENLKRFINYVQSGKVDSKFKKFIETLFSQY